MTLQISLQLLFWLFILTIRNSGCEERFGITVRDAVSSQSLKRLMMPRHNESASRFRLGSYFRYT